MVLWQYFLPSYFKTQQLWKCYSRFMSQGQMWWCLSPRLKSPLRVWLGRTQCSVAEMFSFVRMPVWKMQKKRFVLRTWNCSFLWLSVSCTVFWLCLRLWAPTYFKKVTLRGSLPHCNKPWDIEGTAVFYLWDLAARCRVHWLCGGTFSSGLFWPRSLASCRNVVPDGKSQLSHFLSVSFFF